MKTLAILLFLGSVIVSKSEEKTKNKLVVIDENFYRKEWIVYNSDHDIVNILVPLNSHKRKESSHEAEPEERGPNVAIFFVEADVQSDGTRVDQGLYVLKKNKANKLLNHGRDMAAPGDASNLVYLGASDGLYIYDEDKNAAEKYGAINDSIINIAKEKTGDVVYILTADKEVYKVTDKGNVKEKLEDIINAQQIVLDYSNNIYFYNDNKLLFVRNNEGVKKIMGLPENRLSVTFIKPPYLMNSGVPCVVDNATYIIYPNGTSEVYGIEFKSKYMPTASSMEAAMLQYHAHDKKIYEYNLVTIVKNNELKDIHDFLGDIKEEIKSLSTNNKNIA